MKITIDEFTGLVTTYLDEFLLEHNEDVAQDEESETERTLSDWSDHLAEFINSQ